MDNKDEMWRKDPILSL